MQALKYVLNLSISGGSKTGVSDPADVPGGHAAEQTLHGAPSPQDHLSADPGGQLHTRDGPQWLREEQPQARGSGSGSGLQRQRVLWQPWGLWLVERQCFKDLICWALNDSPDSPSRIFGAGGLRRCRGEQHRRWHPGGSSREASPLLARLHRRLVQQFEIFLHVAGGQPLAFQHTGFVSPPKPSGQPQLSKGKEQGHRCTHKYNSRCGRCHLTVSCFSCRRWRLSTTI